MKTRNSFVSNSSSESFIISKHYISAYQYDLLKRHKELASEYGMDCSDYDEWSIEDLGDSIRCSTGMDNFSLRQFMNKIGINTDDIKWEDY